MSWGKNRSKVGRKEEIAIERNNGGSREGEDFKRKLGRKLKKKREEGRIFKRS